MMLCSLLLLAGQSGTTVYLDNLDLRAMEVGWNSPGKSKSIEGNPLSIHGTKFERGVGSHANSEMMVKLNKNATRFTARVGVDDDTKGRGSVQFLVFVDGALKVDTGVMKSGDDAKSIDLDLKGAKDIRLVVKDGGDGIDYDHADWADAKFEVIDAKKSVQSFVIPPEPTMPIAPLDLNKVQIHGPRVYGCQPGSPFIYRIPATGKGKLTYKAEGLPEGLSLNGNVITGKVLNPGTSRVTLTVKGSTGTDTRELKLVCGRRKLSLTPPMGWNSWNVWGTTVTADKVRASADSFEQSGFANYGYSYVNIDDAWEGSRDANGELMTNEKFGDMAALATYVHSKGLKLGIYSSPGPKTCAGYEGSYKHELQDVMSYAKWGIDYLKYDWCSYGEISRGENLYELQKPYIVMRDALDQAPRDIVYSLCQYGMGDVWNWGGKIGGNAYRTTGDITDTWDSMSGIGFIHSDRAIGAAPGHWNDPDMLVVGKLGWSGSPRPTRLSGNEQITHITLWSMLAAPLLIGCDMTQVDDFTKRVLMNHDVIEVDQDALGKAATRISQKGELEVWTRPLADGTTAVAFFNRSRVKAKISVKWSELGLKGDQPVRDLWQRKDLGLKTGGFSATVAGHGATLYKVGQSQ